ncbi:MAG TPA: hypothetical protein PLD59_03410 [Tepidisphaeraceae bacterium]|nr:hypothetical protein [Tepidisphaeraceae bacterium]
MRKWLSRLTFSFLIVAAACGFELSEGLQNRRPGRPGWQNVALGAAAVGAFAAFLASVRIRHSRNDPSSDRFDDPR